MKKFLVLLCSLLLIFGLAACGEQPEVDGSPNEKPTGAHENCSHDYRIAENVAASCTANGFVKYVCSLCQHSYQVETPAVAHSYADATCQEPKTCTVCQHVEGVALEHNYEVTEQVEATCTDAGYTQYTCSRCAASHQEYHEVLSHAYSAATCTEPQTCTMCGATNGSELGHNYVNKTCTRCGNVLGNFTIPAGGYDGSPVTITFYHTMGAALQSVLDYYIEEFNQIYPNIRIVHQSVGSWGDIEGIISNQLAVGMGPNIAYCYSDHVASYNKIDSVVSLDGLIGSTIEYTDAYGQKQVLGLTADQLDDFIEGFFNEGCQYGDELMYSMPLSKSTEVLYYNRTFFEAHGLKVPTTWDEMEELCERILEIDPTCIPLAYDSESNWFINMCAQYGSDYTSATGDHYLFDNETNRSFVARFRQWHTKGYVTTQAILGSYTSNLFVAQSGVRCYMSIASSAGARYQVPNMDGNGEYPFEVDIAMIPQVNPNNPQVIAQGPSLCLFQSENPQEVIASWLFMKFLITNVEFQAEFSMVSGYMPILKSVVEHPVYKQFLASGNGTDRIVSRVLQLTLQNVKAYFTSPAFIGSSTARQVVGELLVQAMTIWEQGDDGVLIGELFRNAIKTCLGFDVPGMENPTTDPLLESVREYIYSTYKDQSADTPRDYQLIGVVYVGLKAYTVEWSANSKAISFITGNDGYVTAILSSDNFEEITYTLTATIVNDQGERVSVSFERVIPSRPKPVKVNGGTYVILWKNYTFSSLGTDKNYGYNPYNEVTFVNGTIKGYTEVDILTLVAVDDGFAIQDAYGRFVYLKGTYNSFNFSYEVPADGYIWQLMMDKDGNYSIVNKMNGKTLCLDTDYGSWGAYEEVTETRMSQLTLVEVDPKLPEEPEEPGENTRPIAGVAYKLGLVHGGNNNIMLYFTGIEREGYPWYMRSTKDVAEAIDVYVEEVSGGMRLYFRVNGIKTYLDMHKDGTHYSLRLTTEPTAVYTWNTEYNTFVAMVEDQECFIGTYGTYDTFSCNKMENISTSYVAHLYASQRPGTLAEQIDEANKLANGAYLPYESVMTGIIVDDPVPSSRTEGEFKFTISDGTNSVLCYFVPVTGGTPVKGDAVTVVGKLTAYNGRAQFDETAVAALTQSSANKVMLSYVYGGSYITGTEYIHTSSNGTIKKELVLSTRKSDALVFTLVDNGDGTVSFRLNNGTYLYADGTNVGFAAQQDDYTKFVLEEVDGGVYIRCAVANYNGKPQYLEVYNGYLTCYGMGSNVSMYIFQLEKAN